MLPRFIASQAWAERQSLSATDLAWFAGCDPSASVPASDDNRCPRCRRHPDEDYEFKLLVPDAVMSTPERISGRAYVGCLCETLYHYAFVHDVDVHQPVGQTRVRAASEVAEPTSVTPPMQHRTLDSNSPVEDMPPGRGFWDNGSQVAQMMAVLRSRQIAAIQASNGPASS